MILKYLFEKTSIILVIVLFLSLKTVFSQDPAFSQFYANPLYLNPALAGTGECSRIMLNYRNQWPSLPENYITYGAAIDHYVEKISGGIGLMFSSDNAGSGIINTNRISGIYSYHLKLSDQTTLNAGFEVTFHNQRLNWNKLVFQDMIDPVSGGINQGNSMENSPENLSVSTIDFSTGLLLGVGRKYFIGIATHHLSQPSLDFYNNSENNFLYRKYTVHAGSRIKLSSGYYDNIRGPIILSPNILYQHQQNANQINFGFYIEKYPLIAGSWYRYNFSNSDGVIFLIGISQKKIRLGYSYDVTLSKLKSTTGGAHEVSLSLLINCDKKRNRPGAIKCPEF